MQKTRIKGKWAGNVVINDKGEIVEPRMLGDGLRPSPVTRDLKWGVEVPKVGDAEEDKKLEDKVICESSVLAMSHKLTQSRRLVRRLHRLRFDYLHVHRQVA